jgi:pimeloyl-ACP methyl ester carboxylesterase
MAQMWRPVVSHEDPTINAADRQAAALNAAQPSRPNWPYLVRIAQGSSPRPDSGSSPVILIHGFRGNEECWGFFANALERAGFNPVYCFRYDGISTGIPSAAHCLTERVSSVWPKNNHRGVHLVGYSLGGLIARYAVQHYSNELAPASVVGIAVPHRGTRVAHLAPGRSALQMRPGSRLLSSIWRTGMPPNVPWLEIRAGRDRVVPRRPELNGFHGDIVEIADRGHRDILTSSAARSLTVGHIIRSGSTLGR